MWTYWKFNNDDVEIIEVDLISVERAGDILYFKSEIPICLPERIFYIKYGLKNIKILQYV